MSNDKLTFCVFGAGRIGKLHARNVAKHPQARVKYVVDPIGIGFNRRFDPTNHAIQSAIRKGEVGDVELVVITSRDPGPPPLDYIKVSGGLFRDMMIHDFDLARWLLGEEPVEVVAK